MIMIEIFWIKLLIFIGVCQFVWKWLKNFPKEYSSQTYFSKKYIFFYLGYTLTLLFLICIDKISLALQANELKLFIGNSLLTGIFAIGILIVKKEKAELDFRYKQKPFDNAYNTIIKKQHFLIIVEILMILVATFLYTAL